jgi:galactan endo-1,6-beta-galactosidase
MIRLAIRCIAVTVLLTMGVARADYTTRINPSDARGTWEGWGCSLAWWANVFGNRDDLADLLFTKQYITLNGQTLPGLGMNIVRYNAGACTNVAINGETMVASPNIPAFKQIEGFWLNWFSSDPTSTSWRWSADANQRAMLLKARDRGANSFELFSNSPLWWMCYNHNPSGPTNGSNDNLQSWNYQQHAVYLATVAKYAKDQWGITFDSVDPFNEPIATWWSATGTQEGCHFNTGTQATVIGHLRSELNLRGLNSTVVAASDESTYDMARSTWNSFSATTKSQIGRVNVHGYQYGGGRRDLLFTAVAGKKLWNTEYGEGDANGLPMATNLNLDFQYLRPTAWCYWQPLDSGGWGLIQSNPGDNWIGTPNPKYFVFAQYSRHILPGMTIIGGGSGSTVAAYDAVSKKLILVTTNYGTAQWITHDLSAFTYLAGSILRWTTATDAGDKYVLRSDLTLTANTLRAYFPANTIQTFEIPVAYVTGNPWSTWQTSRFGSNTTVPEIAREVADPDRDGLPNLLEFALGTDPAAINAAPQILTKSDRLTLQFTRNTSAVDTDLTVQGSDDLINWTDLAQSKGGAETTALMDGVAVKETGASTTRTVEVQDAQPIAGGGHPSRFLRVEARR